MRQITLLPSKQTPLTLISGHDRYSLQQQSIERFSRSLPLHRRFTGDYLLLPLCRFRRRFTAPCADSVQVTISFFLLVQIRFSLAGLMDFSPLTDAMASRSYDKIADVCDQLMLQIASEGVAFQDEWPYAVHLLGHIYLNDLNSARFLWKSIPPSIKESRPEVAAVWKIGQQLWTRNYAGVYDSLRGFNWSAEIQDFVTSFAERYTRRMFELLMSAYSTISIQDASLFLGMNENDATNYVLQQGWNVDAASQMFLVKKQAVVSEHKIDPSKLQRLTEYVFHLEH